MMMGVPLFGSIIKARILTSISILRNPIVHDVKDLGR
jgi:hypothetical protein